MKKYLIVGALVLISLVIFAPKVLPKTFAAPIACDPTTTSCPTFNCDSTIGVCSDPGDNSGQYGSYNACANRCKPVTTINSLAPNKGFLPVYVNELITVTWSTSNMASNDNRCSGYVDGALVSSTLPPTSQVSNLSWGTGGTHTVGIQCTNGSGQGNLSTASIVVNNPPMDPTLGISASPSSGGPNQSGNIHLSLTSNDDRTAADFTCHVYSEFVAYFGVPSPTPVPGWEPWVTVSPDVNKAYPPLPSTSVFGFTCSDSNGNQVGDVRTTVTITPPPGTLTIAPKNAEVCQGQDIYFSAEYNPGAIRYGKDANLVSGNAAVISNAAENPTFDTFHANAVGTTTIYASYYGLHDSTNVTVLDKNSANCKIPFAVDPRDFGAADATAKINITGAPPSTWGNLTRTQVEYDDYSVGPANRTKTITRNQWVSSDGNGSVIDIPTSHSCSNDGTGSPVVGYREEVGTYVLFGTRQSTTLQATKDCRGTIMVTYKNGRAGSWSITGQTSADNTTVGTVNHVFPNSPNHSSYPSDNQSGTSGQDTWVSYKATASSASGMSSSYTINTACTVEGGLTSKPISPGTTANFVLNCPPGNPVYACEGAIPAGNVACAGTGVNLTSNKTYVGVANCSANQNDKCEYHPGTYSCVGAIPGGNSACPGTGANLINNRPYVGVISCSANQNDRCEYYPTPADKSPVGFFDAASCALLEGWTCDPDNYPAPLTVNFYDGPRGGGGVLVGSSLASNTREPGVGAACGNGTPNHGYAYPTPDQLKNNAPHSVYVYALDNETGVPASLAANPKSITCPPQANSLFVTLSADPSSGSAPLTSNLTATVSGSAAGTINYKFWKNCNNATTAFPNACGNPDFTADGSASNPLSHQFVYDSAGTYYPKVLVQRGSASNAQAITTVTASEPPGGCPSGQTNPYSTCVSGSCTVHSPPSCGVTDCNACPGGGGFSCNGPASGDRGQNLTFTATNGAGGYNWSGGGTPQIGTGSTFTTFFNSTGNKTVLVTDSSLATRSCSVNITSPPGGGGTKHNECVRNACSQVDNAPGNTEDRCGNSTDCSTPPGPTHGVCGSADGNPPFVCTNAAGAAPPGNPGCFNDSGCGNNGSQSHLTCQNASCVIVGGGGSNDPGCDAIGKACSACALTASPSLINVGGSALLKWICADTVSSCTLKGEGSGVDLAGGAANNQVGVKVTPAKSTTYTLNCTQGAVPVTTTAAVKVFNLQECNPNDPTCKPPGQ